MKQLFRLVIIVLAIVLMASIAHAQSPTINLGTITLTNGDVDGDNMVTNNDLNIVLSNLDQANCWGDLDGDNLVTTTDLSIVLKNLYLVGDL